MLPGGEAKVATPKRPSAKKRAPRAAAIETLKKELIKHIRAARDHAQSAVDCRAEPSLLERPSKRLLGSLAGVKPWTVTRCFDDSKELELLWRIAGSLEDVMKYGK